MHIKFFLFIVIFLTNSLLSLSPLHAQSQIGFVDARAWALGQTAAITPGFTNPAFSTAEGKRYVAANYLNRFDLKELSTLSAMAQVPNKYLNGAIYISHYGCTEYNEMRGAINVSKALSDGWTLGARVNYLRLHYSEEYSDKGLLTADVGAIYKVPQVEGLTLAALLINPLQSSTQIGKETTSYSADNELTLPSAFIVGAAYKLSEDLVTQAEVDKESEEGLSAKIGVEYHPFSVLYLRGGLISKPLSPTLGLGLSFGTFDLNLGFAHHSDLGLESACGLSFYF